MPHPSVIPKRDSFQVKVASPLTSHYRLCLWTTLWICQHTLVEVLAPRARHVLGYSPLTENSWRRH